MNDKKKMAELIAECFHKCLSRSCTKCEYIDRPATRLGNRSCQAYLFADHLIANGVTVGGKDTDVPTKWIPASEPPKEPGEYIVAQKHWSDGHLETKKGKWNGVEWLVDGRESLMVTHWMPPSPLPESPKGE